MIGFRRDQVLLTPYQRARQSLFLKLVRDFERFPLPAVVDTLDERVADITEYIDGLTDDELRRESGVNFAPPAPMAT